MNRIASQNENDERENDEKWFQVIKCGRHHLKSNLFAYLIRRGAFCLVTKCYFTDLMHNRERKDCKGFLPFFWPMPKYQVYEQSEEHES